MGLDAACVRGWKGLSKEIALREASVDDAPVLALIGAATLLESFAGLLSGRSLVNAALKNHTPGCYARLLSEPATRAWVAELPSGPDASGAPVGYLMLTAPEFPPEILRPGDLELKRIYLFSRFHGGGTGQRMMDLALSEAQAAGARRVLIGVHRENRRAIAFYARNGFREMGRREFRLGDSVYDDPVLGLELSAD